MSNFETNRGLRSKCPKRIFVLKSNLLVAILTLICIGLFEFGAQPPAHSAKQIIVLYDNMGLVQKTIAPTPEARKRIYVDELSAILYGGKKPLYDSQTDFVSIYSYGVPKNSPNIETSYLNRRYISRPGSRITSERLESLVKQLPFDGNWSGASEVTYLGLVPAGKDLGSNLVDQIYMIVVSHDPPAYYMNTNVSNQLTNWKQAGVQKTEWAAHEEQAIKSMFSIDPEDKYSRDIGGMHLRVFSFKPKSNIDQLPIQQRDVVLKRSSEGYSGTISVPKSKESHFEQTVVKYAVGNSTSNDLTADSIDVHMPAKTSASKQQLNISRKFRYVDGTYDHLQISVVTSSQIVTPPPATFWWGIPVPASLLRFGNEGSIATVLNVILAVIVCLIVGSIIYVTTIRAKPVDPEGLYISASNQSDPFRVQLGLQSSQMILIGKMTFRDRTKPSMIGKHQGHYSVQIAPISEIDAGSINGTLHELISLDPTNLLQKLDLASITGEKTIQVYLNPKAVIDSSAPPSSNPITIRFNLSCSLFKSENFKGDFTQFSHTEHCRITLMPVPGIARMTVQQDLLETDHILGKDTVTIGTVKVKNATVQKYATAIQPGVEVAPGPKSRLGTGGGLPVFLLRPKGETKLSGSPKVNTDPLDGQETAIYELILDLATVPSLATTENYPFTVQLLRSDEPPFTGSIRLKPDPTTAQPMMHVVMSEATHLAPWFKESALPQDVSAEKALILKSGILSYSESQYYLASLRLSNVAKVRDGQVVYHLNVKEELSGELERRPGELLVGFTSSITIRNNEMDVTIPLSLAPQRLGFKSGKKDGKIKIRIQLTAATDQEGKRQEWITQTLVFNAPLRRDLGDKWLALDFGTAATVAVFSDDYNGQTEFTDSARLNAARGMLNLREQYIRQNNRHNLREEGTPFLPSDLLLKNADPPIRMDIKEFIDLAPDVDSIVNNASRYVPYLKSIIGHERIPLPRPMRFIDEFGEIVTDKPSVRPVLTNVCRAIFSDIIMSILDGKGDQLNQLVLTVPNTFSAPHLKLLRDVVGEATANRFLDIEVLSESDAVAFYYAKSWARLNKARSPAACEALKSVEHVLVYDMGAGTLDLSYLRITKENFAIRKIEMIDKLGKPLAGNVLNYHLAKEINEIARLRAADSRIDFIDLIRRPTESDTSRPGQNERLQNNRIQLSDVVRRGKENLGNTGKSHPVSFARVAMWNGIKLDNIDWDTIASSKSVQDFLVEATDGIIDQFFASMGSVPIDTLILSGRSTKFPGIKDRTEQAMARWVKPTNSGYGPVTLHLPDQDLKVAVTLGALAYATTYRANGITREDSAISGRFGFLYTDPRGDWQFMSFLSRNSKATRTPDLVYEAANTLNCEGTGTLVLVHTYSVDPAKDMRDGRWNDMSQIGSWRKDKIGTKPQIRLRLTLQNELYISFNGNPFERIKAGLSLKANEVADESLWPLYLTES